MAAPKNPIVGNLPRCCARPERPRRRTAKKRDELLALHVRLQVQEVTLYWLKSTLIGLKSASKDYRGAQIISAKYQ
jgi:hypothetical protein